MFNFVQQLERQLLLCQAESFTDFPQHDADLFAAASPRRSVMKIKTATSNTNAAATGGKVAKVRK